MPTPNKRDVAVEAVKQQWAALRDSAERGDVEDMRTAYGEF